VGNEVEEGRARRRIQQQPHAQDICQRHFVVGNRIRVGEADERVDVLLFGRDDD